MNVLIKKIALFSAEGVLKDVSLDGGLNIITGDSKTGKSALIEIVDYCLFSSRSTIPVGKITRFTELFCIILELPSKYLVIGRPTWSTEQSKAYFSVEISANFLENFSYDYFSDKTLRKIKYDVISSVEEHLGLSVLDTRSDSETDKRTAGKSTMRSFVPFLFQHQNLIANKHSLFYRFDDFYKRKDTIDELPILLGWVDGAYYSVLRRLEDKTKLLTKERKRLKNLELKQDEQIQHLRVPLEQYYTSIGYVLEDDLKLHELKKRAKNLPEVPLSANEDSDIEIQLSTLNGTFSNKRDQLIETKLLIKQINENSDVAHSYGVQLKDIVSTNADVANADIECPFCKSKTPEIVDVIRTVNNSKKELVSELSSIGTYYSDSSLHLEQLLREEELYKKEIRLISRKIKSLEEVDIEIQKNSKLRDGLHFYKGKIQGILDRILAEPSVNDSTIDLAELAEDIKKLTAQLKGYDLDAKYEDANAFLSQKMTEISEKLDFEEELQPGVMRFNLKTFDFYYNFDKVDIRLSEMGSGANWLACHLSLFLALQHLICKEENSVIPSFLFIDQPSQVYFPKASKVLSTELASIEDEQERKEADKDILQVKNVFKVIIEELTSIKDNYGFSPQIVVLEHADEEEFAGYVKERWATNGKKLI